MTDSGFYWLLLALLGAATGSLLNVVTWRLPLMIGGGARPGFNLWLPASHCPQCKTTVRWHDNIPLLSWLLLKGRCRHCCQPVSRRYPLTEFGTLLLTLALGWLFPPGGLLLAVLLFSWLLLALVLIDAEHQLLPDALTLPLLWLGLSVNLLEWLPHLTLAAAVSGAIAGYLSLALLAQGYRLLSGKDALGLGDAKLLAALGAWLGWQPLPLLLLLASVSGIIWVLLGRLLFRRSLNAPLPFGPFLAAAGLLLLISANHFAFF
ncbi:prepilin peptidase [Erwinia pyrifoliae]|uniref:Prepilin leader peptidase/N-methyltransferase n=1 Tax=Erwinia pyrifoliae TaxID=79967 RepID=A0ABY5X6X4_ERWPY|nr:A24 family peptidase [Erwinia pyrifoliae]AUX73668.1 prepilin peptidase [Erwinia pyrifoliae]MCA8876021.1 prepilin peptidase [Erwinia pyrifoliae]MCT2387821.1 prepilin peptidase [Erwinia pyrifoliae]MCU8586077.1 prepilin peptidase [Erwinia pyrifoliae]UWS28636.1 prepilin peptidase [Erwinia pyrifoliae]